VNYADIERFCLSLPGARLDMPWSDTRVFKIGGKMFAVIALEEKRPWGLWFKASRASFEILTRLKGISPCPYFARACWVEMEGLKPPKQDELKAYLARAHALVAAKLSRKMRNSLGIAETMPDEKSNPFV
jgi:predicted DNA-binding protein (MmcQ/YjbR family)